MNSMLLSTNVALLRSCMKSERGVWRLCAEGAVCNTTGGDRGGAEAGCCCCCCCRCPCCGSGGGGDGADTCANVVLTGGSAGDGTCMICPGERCR